MTQPLVPTAEELAYLATHGELLLMLSLRRMEAMLDAAPAPPAPSADELAAAEAATMVELARQQQAWLASSAEGVAPGGEADFSLPAVTLPTGGVDIGPEIDAALARAYANITARAQSLRGVDATGFPALLAALPTTLPPLTGPLDAVCTSAWLDLYDSGDPALHELMTQAATLQEHGHR